MNPSTQRSLALAVLAGGATLSLAGPPAAADAPPAPQPGAGVIARLPDAPSTATMHHLPEAPPAAPGVVPGPAPAAAPTSVAPHPVVTAPRATSAPNPRVARPSAAPEGSGPPEAPDGPTDAGASAAEPPDSDPAEPLDPSPDAFAARPPLPAPANTVRAGAGAGARPDGPSPTAASSRPAADRRSGSGPGAAPATGRTVVVVPGDSFWRIARQEMEAQLGHAPTDEEVGSLWVDLVAANRDRLPVPGDADLLFPGMEVMIPAA